MSSTRADLLSEAIVLASERAAVERAPILVYEARRWRRGRRGDWMEPVFYVRSEHDDPPPREDRVPDYGGPVVTQVVHPPKLALRFVDAESDPTVIRIQVASAASRVDVEWDPPALRRLLRDVMDPSRMERDLRRWQIRRFARARKSRRGWR